MTVKVHTVYTTGEVTVTVYTVYTTGEVTVHSVHHW